VTLTLAAIGPWQTSSMIAATTAFGGKPDTAQAGQTLSPERTNRPSRPMSPPSPRLTKSNVRASECIRLRFCRNRAIEDLLRPASVLEWYDREQPLC